MCADPATDAGPTVRRLSMLDGLAVLHGPGDQPPLYCVHPASGSAYCYSGLAQLLGPRQPVFGLESPGLDDDRLPVDSVADLVDAHLVTMSRAGTGAGVCLLGWSMGGTVAFELAHRLRSAGTEVAALIIVDAPVPQRAERPSDQDVLRRFLLETGGPAVESDDQAADLLRILRQPPEDDTADEFTALRIRYAAFRANTWAFIAHRITRRYPAPIHLIRAVQSPADRMRWNDWADDVTSHVVPGDHLSMWTGATLTILAQTVRQILAAATVEPGRAAPSPTCP